jgi:phosphoglycerate dehydrogenase-like enzyme
VRVVFCGTGWFPIVDAIQARLPPGVTVEVRDPARPLVEAVRDADILLPSNARINAAAIAAPRRLLLIQQPAVGTEGIDLSAARARGVPVCNAPGTNGQSVAEAALLLILALARRLPRAQKAFAERAIGAPLGFELASKTLGLLGRGRSGSALARIAEAIGMKVISVSSKSSRADLLELASRSDVMSVHCPLTPATRGLVDAEVLGRMPEGALLVNCARGGIVDRRALEDALERGHLGGAGLDVFWEEPWDPGEALYQREDVVVLPHVAGSTEEAFARVADIVAGNIGRVMRGEELLHRIA